jgi:hypothetical protein
MHRLTLAITATLMTLAIPAVAEDGQTAPPAPLEPAPAPQPAAAIEVRPQPAQRTVVTFEASDEDADAEPVTRAPRRRQKRGDTWADNATFFIGGRTAVAFPPGGEGPAPMAGAELGVAADKGFGFGLHMFGAMNTPGAPMFNLPKTPYGFGAEVDLRYYLQTIEPLTLYPTLSVGFMAGPGEIDGKNVVLPLVTPGFGARMKFGSLYTAFELGAASFYIPFMAVAVGWTPEHT